MMIEEHRANASNVEGLQQTSTTIIDIVNEIKSINNLFRPTPEDSPAIIEQPSAELIDGIIQTIATCTTIDEFIQRTFPAAAPMSDGGAGDLFPSTDTQLLTMLQLIVTKINNAPEFKVVPASKLEIDQGLMSYIKSQIRDCFQELGEREKFTHDLDSQIMSIGPESMTFFSPMTNTWTDGPDQTFPGIQDFNLSTVYARGHVYLFGTGDNYDSYSRFSLATRQWEHSPVPSLENGFYCSACYDGDKIIYVIGNETGHQDNAKIFSFNIDTQQLVHVGKFDARLTIMPSYVDYHNQVLYSIDVATMGENDIASTECIDTFNLITKDQATIPLPGSVYSSVSDGQGMLYMIVWTPEQTAFISLSLTSQEIVYLTDVPPPAEGRRRAYKGLLCSSSEKGTLYLLEGQDSNYRYSIDNGQWTKIVDNDTSISHTSQGKLHHHTLSDKGHAGLGHGLYHKLIDI
ncbi:hypothetical protein SAMD00019534_030140 [Acytostelium subglobosum LB1]|uniref:hypothetical protein n=1 Tax=Acytostelium subglobosum LB1 TaxID=1410327 RepID=UPI000644EADF|nr:hypothetical protein SAMD00019534_030140 [Acytostelium subglobosum LB1]GAM19839.1 hypothetical protein SAMD00019534_030140 [Acytostelium subglobosum LB1]|eukprot:XP_012756601.1 hypothetical protein SAMD00019534_030140 [Acytostelium subglobosum LB1]